MAGFLTKKQTPYRCSPVHIYQVLHLFLDENNNNENNSSSNNNNSNNKNNYIFISLDVDFMWPHIRFIHRSFFFLISVVRIPHCFILVCLWLYLPNNLCEPLFKKKSMYLKCTIWWFVYIYTHSEMITTGKLVNVSSP